MKLGCRVKREPKLLLSKAVESLTLAIELFNRPSDIARGHSAIIMIDHAFEMLLKAAILHHGGRIRDPGAKYTIDFQTCLNRAYSSADVKFLNADESLTLQTINGLRDAAQHHIVDISEPQLYIHIQSGVTLFCDIVEKVFQTPPQHILPRRVLPVSTTPPRTIETLFGTEIGEIKNLLLPARRRKQEAIAALRPLAILDRSLRGEHGQPSEQELGRLANQIRDGAEWQELFPGAAMVNLIPDGDGPNLTLRIAKQGEFSVDLVKEQDGVVPIVAVRRVSELDFYNLGATQVAKHLGITLPRFSAFAKHLGLRDNEDYFKVIAIGKTQHHRYSQKAVTHARTALENLSGQEFDAIWEANRPRRG